MLVVNNLEVFIKNINILQSVSFKVSNFSSIIGRNGAGKTTLIRAIMNILPANKGNIKFNDNEIGKILKSPIIWSNLNSSGKIVVKLSIKKFLMRQLNTYQKNVLQMEKKN